ncbi:hypothetical protein ACVWZ6_007043 [Bradyrhizobium sp. GM6.1]
MHVASHGDPASWPRPSATRWRKPTPLTVRATDEAAADLATARLDEIIGAKGQSSGALSNVKRRDPISQEGMPLTPVGPMGVHRHQLPADGRR